MTYRFGIENLRQTYPDMEPLYRAHYKEMKDRLDANGTPIGEYNPDLESYFHFNDIGHLVHYTVRTEAGEAVGYCNMYISKDMHNQEPIATEDTVFVRRDHRNGVGRTLVRAVLADLQRRGVKRITIMPVTDLRVGKIWRRMGFRPVAEVMTYIFPENADVRA